jgi:hypothetical protein
VERFRQGASNIQNQIPQALASKLTIAISKIESLMKKSRNATGAEEEQKQQQRPSGVMRWKYALLKEYLDKAINDLESWQRIFDPSWFLVMKVASQLIDTELDRDYLQHASFSPAHHLRDALRDEPQIKVSVFLSEDGLDSDQPSTYLSLRQRQCKRQARVNGLYYIRSAANPQASLSLLLKDIRNLARKPSKVDPVTTGPLNCCGVIRVIHPSNRQPTSFKFVFRTTEWIDQSRSLRSSLTSGDIEHSFLIDSE